MRSPPLTALVVAACGAAACGGAARAPALVNTPPPSEIGYLVWVREDKPDVPPTTRWLDARGDERGRADGIWIAAGARLYRVDAAQREEATKGCEEKDDGSTVPGKASLTTLRLVDRDGAVALADGAAEAEAADQHHGASVVAGLGRYVIVVESEDVFACGAHGNEDVRTRTIDATTGAEVAPWVSIAEVDAAAARARAALISPGALTDGDALGEAQLGVTVPTWTDGRVGVSHLIYFDTCYACGNGVWSSYTSGGWAAGDKVPAAVADEARDVPAPVARALSSISAPSDAPAQAGVSWGAVTSAWTAAFPHE